MKIFAALLSLCLALLCLPAMAGETEIRFSWWGGAERHEATLAAIRQFEQDHPGITVKAEYMGWNGYLERLTTQIGGGSAPDLMQMDWAWLSIFSKTGDGFADLNRFPDAVNLDAYDAKWLATCTIDGKLNALPVSFTTRYFVWNKSVWDKAGLPLPKTWDDLLAAGPVFQEKLGAEYFPLDMEIDSVTHMLASYIFQKTGKMIIDPVTSELGLTRDELVECFGYYKRLVDNKSITSMPYRVARSGDPLAQTHEQSEFITGEWAGAYYWDSNITLLLSTPQPEFEFVLGDYPTQTNAATSGRIGRPAQIFGVGAESKHPEITASLASYLLTTPEAARTLGTTRGVLVATPAFEALKEAELIAPVNIEASEQIADVQVYNPSPYFEDPRMLKELRDIIENLSYDKITPEEAADTAERIIPRLLRRLTR